MNVVTVPQKITKGEELVIIPRKEYEAFLRLKKNGNSNIVVKRDKSFKVPKRHEKFYDELDKKLTQALREYERTGRLHGPFSSVGDLKKSLEQ